MFLRRKTPPPVSLWRAVGARELQALEAVGWSTWPQTSADDALLLAHTRRPAAVRLLRQQLVPTEGEGSLVVFDVPPDVLARPGVRAPGGMVALPKGRRLTRVVGDITEEAQYRRGADQAEVDAVREAFGELVPDAWRAMVTAPSWLRRGWTTAGHYVDLHPPADAVRATQVWTAEMVYHPGVLVIGTDGHDRRLAIDLREDDPPVRLLHRASTGWDDAPVQAASVRELAVRLEEGDFAYSG